MARNDPRPAPGARRKGAAASESAAPRRSRFSLRRKPKTGESRTAQIRQTYQMARKGDPNLGRILLGIFLGIFAVFLLVGVLLHQSLLLTVLGFSVALLVTTVIFGRRAEASAIRQIASTPGAGAAVLGMLRKGFTTIPAVTGTKQQDIVHRVTGKCGVVLVGEGNPIRSRTLLQQEARRTERLLGADIPVTTIVVGDAEGQVSLKNLTKHVMKLPKTLRPSQVTEINNRMRAIGNPLLQQMPKGPMPRGAKMPRPPAMPR